MLLFSASHHWRRYIFYLRRYNIINIQSLSCDSGTDRIDMQSRGEVVNCFFSFFLKVFSADDDRYFPFVIYIMYTHNIDRIINQRQRWRYIHIMHILFTIVLNLCTCTYTRYLQLYLYHAFRIIISHEEISTAGQHLQCRYLYV